MKTAPFREIKTTRLHLRQLTVNDWEAICFLRSDKEVNKFVQRPSAETKEEALTFIEKILNPKDKIQSCYWVITTDNNNQMIGSICLWNFTDDRKHAEVGYDLNPKFHGQGIMTEALKAILSFGFKELNLLTIEAYTQKNNAASIKLLLANGFKFIPDKSDADNLLNQVYEIKAMNLNH